MTNSVAGPKSLSLAGNQPAAPLGYYSWTLGQAARDPLYILIVIYIFFPYFSNVVIGDPVRGQALVGYVNTFAGIAMALTVPFLGAIADKTGHLKPWLLTSTLAVSVCAFGLWWVTPDSLQQGLGLLPVLGALIVMNVAFAYTEVFHNAMLPRIAPADKAGFDLGPSFRAGKFWWCVFDVAGALRLCVAGHGVTDLDCGYPLVWNRSNEPSAGPDRRTHSRGLAVAVYHARADVYPGCQALGAVLSAIGGGGCWRSLANRSQTEGLRQCCAVSFGAHVL